MTIGDPDRPQPDRLHRQGLRDAGSREDIQLLKNIGSTSVTIVPTWYVNNTSANEIKPNPKKTPTDASLARAINLGQQAGLKVILKPHVDVIDETFRGEIQPADRAVVPVLRGDDRPLRPDLAASKGADVFVVGTGAQDHFRRYRPSGRRWLEGVSAKFGGPLTYAANWDEVDQVQFWDNLDMIGVDAYYPLTSEGQEPTEDDLVSAWQTPASNLEATSSKWGKPVMFTEIGYPTQADAAAHPPEVGRASRRTRRRRRWPTRPLSGPLPTRPGQWA
ncbi:MAG: hypothetical protein IPK93_00735 [Solirubrobacterales bacterium]|nr:hypothetical protein [Solirubrobacterales bacterium]